MDSKSLLETYMNKQLIFLALTIIIFCSFFGNNMSKESKIVHKIVREVSIKYEKKYRLKFAGISLAAPRGIYRDIGISFDYYGQLSKDISRKILVESATDLIKRINDSVELRPYLKNYPFTGNNVTITIFLSLPSGKSIYYPDIKIAEFTMNEARYIYDTPETDCPGDYFLIEEESLEEARKILGKQNENSN